MRLTNLVAAIAGTLAFAGAAQGATLNATYNGLFAGTNSGVPAGTIAGSTPPGFGGGSTQTGLFNFTANTVPTGVVLIDDSSAGSNFLAMCLEPVEFIGAGSYNFTYTTTNNAPVDSAGNPNVPMSNDNRYLDLARLLNGAFPTWDSTLGLIDGAAISATTVLALQLAVWEVANEKKINGYDLLNGDFKLTSGSPEATAANGFLAKIGVTWNDTTNFYRALTIDGKQDYVIKIIDDGDTVVPIPAAAWLLGSGLLGLFGLARRRPKSVEG